MTVAGHGGGNVGDTGVLRRYRRVALDIEWRWSTDFDFAIQPYMTPSRLFTLARRAWAGCSE